MSRKLLPKKTPLLQILTEKVSRKLFFREWEQQQLGLQISPFWWQGSRTEKPPSRWVCQIVENKTPLCRLGATPRSTLVWQLVQWSELSCTTLEGSFCPLPSQALPFSFQGVSSSSSPMWVPWPQYLSVFTASFKLTSYNFTSMSVCPLCQYVTFTFREKLFKHFSKCRKSKISIDLDKSILI